MDVCAWALNGVEKKSLPHQYFQVKKMILNRRALQSGERELEGQREGEEDYGKEANEQIIILPRRKTNRGAFN